MSYVISVSNVKGGVAKTSTCVALGSALAQKGHRVLLVDLDPQADLTLGVGITMQNVAYGSKDLFIPGILKKLELSSFVAHTKYPKLDIVPSNGDLMATEQVQANYEMFRDALKGVLDSGLASNYDFVVIDCPPAANLYTLSALGVSDLVLIPTQAEYFSANSLLKMMSVVRMVRQRGNPNLKYRVLVTLLDLRSRIQRTALDEFRSGFRENLFTTCILMDTKIRESQSLRIPIVHYKAGSRGAVLYHLLADEVVAFASGIVPQSVTEPQFASVEVVHPLAEESLNRRCPFLGYQDDLKTVTDFPSELNYCHRANPNATPVFNHQSGFCLGSAYASCPMLASSSEMRLPANLQLRPPSLWNRLGF